MYHMLHVSYPITVFWLHKSLLTWRSLIKQHDTYSSKCTRDIKSSKNVSSVLNSMENSVYDLHMTDLMKTISVSLNIALTGNNSNNSQKNFLRFNMEAL